MLKMLLHLAFISVQEFPLVLGHFSEISPESGPKSGPADLRNPARGKPLKSGPAPGPAGPEKIGSGSSLIYTPRYL